MTNQIAKYLRSYIFFCQLCIQYAKTQYNCEKAFTVASKNPLKIAVGNGIFACQLVFLCGQRSECADLLRSYKYSTI